MSNGLFIGLAGLICAGVFLNGVRFARMDRNPFAGRKVMGMPIQGSGMSVSQVNRVGKLQMLAAPVLFLLLVLVVSGTFGPVEIR